MVTGTQEKVAMKLGTWQELRDTMTAWQGVSQGSIYLSLSLCPLSSLLVSAIGQIKLRARRKGNCVPGHHSLPSQGTDQGGQGWMVGLEEQEMKAQQGSVPFTLLG